MTSKVSDGIVIISTKGNIMFSSTGEITTVKKAPRKHRVQKNITNKSFEELRKFNNDEFWDNILVKFSRNAFPVDFRFINNTLFYKYKSKNHKDEIFIDSNNYQETFDKLKIFLKNKGIMSVKEVNENNNEDLRIERKKIINWKDAGKNQIILLYDYIDDMKKKLNLDKNEIKHFESLLKVVIYNNIITNDHITLEDERIKNIQFLKWDKDKRIFNLDINKIKIKSSKQEKRNEDKFYTISSFSDDKHIIMNKEVEIENLGKKWDDFLTSYYDS